MPSQALFGISVAFGFIAWGIVAAQYLWPERRDQPRISPTWIVTISYA